MEVNERENRPLMVAIKCFTYNHEPYIRQCLEGFVMQQTNFRFVALVVDDASTDHTADIIREYELKYPDIIKPIYLKENHYSQKKPKYPYIQKWFDVAKYIATCEGDDYWTDPLKLQKQVDFLEANPDYGIVCTLANLNVNGVEIPEVLCKTSNQLEPEELLLANSIVTLTVLIRISTQNLANNLITEYKAKGWRMGDYPMWLALRMYSKIGMVEEVTGTYRVLSESASHSRNKKKMYAFWKDALDIKLYFFDKYQQANILSEVNYSLRFQEMVFHTRKRFLLDYGWLAKEQILLFLRMPFNVWKYVIKQKCKRIKRKK